MKGKFSSTWRVVTALVLVLSLGLVIAAPVAAQTAGTIELDADWYKTGDTVTVTIEDADLDILNTETQDESSTTPDGTVKAFYFTHTDIQFASVSKVYDMSGDEYLVQSVSGALGRITLQAAPPAEAELMAATSVADDLSLDVQPQKSTALKLTMSAVAIGGETVTITGIVGGSADSEIVTFGAGETTKTTTKVFDSVDANGIDAAGYTAGGTITITCANLVFADYTYYGVDTFEGKVISSVDADGVTPEMTETGPHTGIFEGTLKLAAATNDTLTPPELAVVDGGTITAKYTDADPVATVTASATIDDTDPTLINESPADGAKINDSTPLISIDVLDFESGVLGTPALGMNITGPGAVSPLQTEIADGYHLEYQLGTSEALAEGTITVTITAEDIVGNAVDPNSWTFDVDLTAPTMDSAETATTTTIDVTFSEDLDEDTVVAPDFLVDGTVTPTQATVTGAVVTLTVPEMATDATPTVELVGAVSDIAGNELTGDEAEVTATDGVGSTVAIAVSPDPCGAEEATFDLTFSEIMKTGVAPTVAFTDTGGSKTVTGGWTSTTTWQGTCDVSDLAAQEFESVVTVTGGKDLPGNVMAEATGSFDIDTKVADPTFWPADGATVYTTSPVVRVTFTEEVTITAATFDDEDVLTDLTTTDSKTYRLATGGLEEGSHTFTVSAEDSLGNTISGATATFSVSVSQDISLSEGWNLISLPLIPDDSSIDVVLADISGSVSMVQYYYNNSAEDQGWLWYQPGVAESTLATMEDGKGYWVNMSSSATLTITGSQMPPAGELPPTYPVAEGWNLIGFKSTADMDNTVYLINLGAGTGYTVLWGYEPDEGYFNVHPMNEHGGVPNVDIGDMEVGYGYWLWATESGIIVPVQ